MCVAQSNLLRGKNNVCKECDNFSFLQSITHRHRQPVDVFVWPQYTAVKRFTMTVRNVERLDYQLLAPITKRISFTCYFSTSSLIYSYEKLFLPQHCMFNVKKFIIPYKTKLLNKICNLNSNRSSYIYNVDYIFKLAVEKYCVGTN